MQHVDFITAELKAPYRSRRLWVLVTALVCGGLLMVVGQFYWLSEREKSLQQLALAEAKLSELKVQLAGYTEPFSESVSKVDGSDARFSKLLSQFNQMQPAKTPTPPWLEVLREFDVAAVWLSRIAYVNSGNVVLHGHALSQGELHIWLNKLSTSTAIEAYKVSQLELAPQTEGKHSEISFLVKFSPRRIP